MIGLSGLVVGSFLGLVVYRTPKSETLVTIPSHCEACSSRIFKRDLIPLLSFLLLKGKCRFWQVKISIDKPFIEILSAVSFIWCFSTFESLAQYLFSLCLNSLLITITFIDIKYFTILYKFQFIMFIFGLISLSNGHTSLLSSCIGALSISSLFFLITILTKSLGGGDGLLMATSGFLVGYPAIIIVFIISTITATLFALVFQKKNAIPFAPFICLGVFVAYYYGPHLITSYLHYLSFSL